MKLGKSMTMRWILVLAVLIPNIAVAATNHRQAGAQDQAMKAAAKETGPREPVDPKNVNEPAFNEYRGVTIGMTASEIREKLGKPRLKDKSQDLFVFGESESVQFFYDAKENVYAISVDFTGDGAPTAREVLGEDIAARDDGSMYQMKQYPDAGYWVSYSRTTSKPPHVTITMQKISH
jgi:hypothetical protein